MTTNPDVPSLEVRRADAGTGVQWWQQGWSLFAASPGAWIGIGVVFALIVAALHLVPGVGSLAASVLMPVFVGGAMLGCRAIERGESLELSHLFAGFSADSSKLLVVGLAVLAVDAVTIVVGGATVFGAIAVFDGATTGAATALSVLSGLVAILVILVVAMLVSWATWLAPALIVDRHIAPLEAMKASFRACAHNLGALTIFGLMFIAFAIVASLPLMLGWVVLLPVMATSTWAAYRDVFG